MNIPRKVLLSHINFFFCCSFFYFFLVHFTYFVEAEIHELETSILDRTKALRNAISVVDQRESTVIEQEKVQIALLHKLKDEISSKKISYHTPSTLSSSKHEKKENGDIDAQAVQQKEKELKELDRKIKREKRAAKVEEKRIQAEIAALQDTR